MDNSAPPTTERPPSGQGPGDQAQGPRVTREQVKDLGRLRRSVADRRVAGVAGGLARHLDVDPILIRVALVVAVFFGGAGLLAYAGAWILVPDEDTADQPLGLDERSRALGLWGVGVLALLAAVGDWAGAFWFPWPVALVALAVLWLVNHNRSSASYAGTTAYGAAPHDTSVPPGSTSHQPAAYDPSYGAASYGTAPYGGVPPATHVGHARPQRPRNPRKRGPVLFWFTLALIALAEGALGVVDAAGADVAPSAYPALALGVTTAMLLVGAFWGRAGGLILVGAVAAAATGITTASTSWDAQSVRMTPGEASEVSDLYEIEAGDLLVDLSRVDDVEALDGEDVRVEGNAGEVTVIVPPGMDVSVTADVAAGDVRIFDQRSDGLGISDQGFLDGGDDAPELHITIDLGVGEVVVRETEAAR